MNPEAIDWRVTVLISFGCVSCGNKRCDQWSVLIPLKYHLKLTIGNVKLKIVGYVSVAMTTTNIKDGKAMCVTFR